MTRPHWTELSVIYYWYAEYVNAVHIIDFASRVRMLKEWYRYNYNYIVVFLPDGSRLHTACDVDWTGLFEWVPAEWMVLVEAPKEDDQWQQ